MVKTLISAPTKGKIQNAARVLVNNQPGLTSRKVQTPQNGSCELVLT